MKHGPGVTAAADLIPMQPAARPEPVASKQASVKDDGVSFADVLETETAVTDSSDELVAATTDANPAVVQPAPQQPPVVPAVNSPEAILAGLTQSAAPQAAAGESIEVPEMTVAAPAQAQAQASIPVVAQPAATQAAAASAPAVAAQAAATAPAAKPAQPAASAPAEDTDDTTDGAEDGAVTPTAHAQAGVPAAVVAQVAPAPVAMTVAPQATDAAPLSAPGAERAAAPAEHQSTTVSTTSSATTEGATKAQTGANKTVQAAAATVDAAPEIKTDAATAPAAPTTDVAATARAPASDVARATQTHPALQNAPATTVQVYQRMIERFDGRAQRYEVRLDPAELGRVDVRIEVGADKKVHAVLAAHDSAALSDLMRGQRSLERALSDAGFDLAEGGIKFELSSDQGRNSANGQDNEGGNANVWRGFKTVDVAVDAQTAAAARPWRSSRFDLVA